MKLDPNDALTVDQLTEGTPVVLISINHEPFDEWIEGFTGTITRHSTPMETITISRDHGNKSETLSYRQLGFTYGGKHLFSFISLESSRKYGGTKMGNGVITPIAYDTLFLTKVA